MDIHSNLCKHHNNLILGTTTALGIIIDLYQRLFI